MRINIFLYLTITLLQHIQNKVIVMVSIIRYYTLYTNIYSEDASQISF